MDEYIVPKHQFSVPKLINMLERKNPGAKSFIFGNEYFEIEGNR